MVKRAPQLFPLGQPVATPGALSLLDDLGVTYFSLLDRHSTGDWGDVPPEDRQANADALANGDRILSSYKFGDKTVWIITKSDRSVTTLLLPDEY